MERLIRISNPPEGITISLQYNTANIQHTTIAQTSALGLTPAFYTHEYTTPGSAKGMYAFGPKAEVDLCWTVSKIGTALLAKCAYSTSTKKFATSQQFTYEIECKGVLGPRIRSVSQPKLCVGVGSLKSMGQKVTMMTCNGQVEQAWTIEEGPPFAVMTTCYTAGESVLMQTVALIRKKCIKL